MINQTKRLLCYNETNFQHVKAIVSRALKNNKFYQKKYKAAGITKTIDSWDDYFKLPMTTKDELYADQKANPPFGTDYSCKSSDIFLFTSTSGTTSGKSLAIPYSIDDAKSAVISELEFLKSKGINKNDTLLNTETGIEIYVSGITAKKAGIKYIPYHPMGPSALYQLIRKFNVNFLHCYPTELFQIMEYAEENGKDVRKLKLKKINTVGEPGWNDKKLRKIVEKKFEIEWTDYVGSQESRYTGHSCNKGGHYHFYPNSKVIEVVNPETGLHDTSGEMIETSLIRRDVPYIRYKTSDLTTLSYSKICKQAVFAGILGRTQDMATFMVVNLNKNSISTQIRQINPANKFYVLIRKKNLLDYLEIFYETKHKKDISKLKRFSNTFYDQYGSYPMIFILPGSTISIGQGQHKFKTIYDLRVNELPKFNYKRAYLISYQYKFTLKIKEEIKKIINFYKKR